MFYGGSAWFDYNEPYLTKQMWCRGGSEGFAFTEPYLTAALQEEQGVEGNCTHLLGGATALNHFDPSHSLSAEERNVLWGCGSTIPNHIFTRGSRCVWYLNTCTGWFNHSEPPRTFTNHFNTEKARCVEVYHIRLRWFDYTEPFRITSSQGDQGVYGT